MPLHFADLHSISQERRSLCIPARLNNRLKSNATGSGELLNTNRAQERWTRARCHWCLEVHLYKKAEVTHKRLSATTLSEIRFIRGKKKGHFVLILLELTDRCNYYLISIMNFIHYNKHSLTDEQTFCRIVNSGQFFRGRLKALQPSHEHAKTHQQDQQ